MMKPPIAASGTVTSAQLSDGVSVIAVEPRDVGFQLDLQLEGGAPSGPLLLVDDLELRWNRVAEDDAPILNRVQGDRDPLGIFERRGREDRALDWEIDDPTGARDRRLLGSPEQPIGRNAVERGDGREVRDAEVREIR